MQNPERDSKYEANQVWNTDIDPDRNRKNSRAALMMLGVTAVLVIGLVVCLAVYLPNVISYSMDSFDFSLPEFSLSDLIDELRTPESVSVQAEPAPEPAILLNDGDLDFLNVFAAYVIELALADDAGMQREIHQMFYPELEYLCGLDFRYNQLREFTWWVMDLNRMLFEPETDRVDYLVAMRELSTVVLTVNEGFYFLSDSPEVLDYYANMQQYTEAMLEVEYSLQFQLVGAETQWSKEYGCQAVCYTNDTPYTLDICFTNDFVTDNAQYSDKIVFEGMLPGVTTEIPLYDLEKVGDRDHTWHLNWEIRQLYMGDIPIEGAYN